MGESNLMADRETEPAATDIAPAGALRAVVAVEQTLAIFRRDTGPLRNLPIDTPSGRPARLLNVATVDLKANPDAIERQGDSPRLDVGASVEGRDLGAVVRKLNETLAGVKYDRGYHAEVLVEYQERQAA